MNSNITCNDTEQRKAERGIVTIIELEVKITSQQWTIWLQYIHLLLQIYK